MARWLATLYIRRRTKKPRHIVLNNIEQRLGKPYDTICKPSDNGHTNPPAITTMTKFWGSKLTNSESNWISNLHAALCTLLITPQKQLKCPITLTLARVFIQFIHWASKCSIRAWIVCDRTISSRSLQLARWETAKIIQLHACIAELEIQQNGAGNTAGGANKRED